MGFGEVRRKIVDTVALEEPQVRISIAPREGILGAVLWTASCTASSFRVDVRRPGVRSVPPDLRHSSMGL